MAGVEVSSGGAEDMPMQASGAKWADNGREERRYGVSGTACLGDVAHGTQIHEIT